MMAPTTTPTTMGEEAISKDSFLPSFVSPRPIRRKSFYKVTGKLREKVYTPPNTTPSQNKKDDDEDH